ncbi:MAG: hypothetical protein RIT28_800, partial [Pseudomonadota bacterium]
PPTRPGASRPLLETPPHDLGPATAALSALATGALDPLVTLLKAWRFVEEPRLVEAAARRLRGRDGALVSAQTLTRLGLGGARWREAEASFEPSLAADAALDAQAALAWTAWFGADYFSAEPYDYALNHLIPRVQAVFQGVLSAAELPPKVRRDTLVELGEGAFATLLTARVEESLPAWLDIATRALERGPGGPLRCLSRVLSPQERASAGLCFASRRLWAPTLAAIWPDDAPRERAAKLSAWLRDDPEALPRITHLHLFGRLIERAATAGPDALGDNELRAICRQNVARARARLRATLAARPKAVLHALLDLDALHARTQDAAGRFAYAWVNRELTFGLSMGHGPRVTTRCVAPEPLPEGANDADPSMPIDSAKGWILLVIFRGRFGHLWRWVYDGTTGDRDSVWGDLLKKELPPSLWEPGLLRPRLRQTLRSELPELLWELEPTLNAWADQDLSDPRRVKARVLQLFLAAVPTASGWPARGYPDSVRHVVEVRRQMRRWSRHLAPVLPSP